MFVVLVVQGRHLDLVVSVADVIVMIGDAECTVTSMSTTQLTCLPNVTTTSVSQPSDVFVCLTTQD